MFFFNIFSKLIKTLHSNESPAQIASGFILGMILGLMPFWSLLNLTLLVVIIIVNVNIAAATLAYMIFSVIIYIFDPLLHDAGFWILVHIEFLQPVWTLLYHSPVFPYTSYNNTVYLGSLILGILLIWPGFLGVKKFILYYRDNYEQRIQNMKWIKWVKATKLYSVYDRLRFLGD